MTDTNELVERRFFIDHGMIHDRVTGKHVSTEPVEYDEGKFDTTPVDDALALLNEQADTILSLREALTPSGDTKAAYHGEFHFDIIETVDGEEFPRRVYVPWDSVKQIMGAIAERAALNGKATGGSDAD